jgi:hypothetical protein
VTISWSSPPKDWSSPEIFVQILLEAGSIINRDEKLKMDSPERRDIVSGTIAAAVKEFCKPFLGPP